jgi:hypothetical protein
MPGDLHERNTHVYRESSVQSKWLTNDITYTHTSTDLLNALDMNEGGGGGIYVAL